LWAGRGGHTNGAPQSLGYARDDKKERVAERRGPLPRARAIVGTVATSISSPFCAKSKKVTTPQDDGFVGELAIQLVGYAASTKDLNGHKLSG
jgi:hypothetical protein